MPSEDNKFVNESFAYTDIARKPMNNSQFIECDFRHANCIGTDFSGSILYRSNFSGAKMANAIISLNCATFRDVIFDRQNVEYLLYLIYTANIPDDIKDTIKTLLGNKIERYDSLFGR